MSPNCSGVARRPRETIGTTKAVSTDGSWPRRPTEYWVFVDRTARTTSAVVTPSAAIRSGLSQTRIA
jgi:hypothetical protein